MRGIWEIGRKLPSFAQRAIFNSRAIMKLLGQEYFGTDHLDRKLKDFLDLDRPGYFIEIGANNGVAQSNTKHLELFHDWKGLLVEPWRPNFERLKITRSRTTNSVHAACVSFSYPKETVDLYFSNLLTIAEGLESEKSDAYLWAKGAEFLIPDGGKVQKFSAPARTLDSILDEITAPREISLFSLDVEGAEIEVLKGINFEKYKFEVLCIESDSVSAIESFLGGNGYQMAAQLSFHDYIFVPK